MTATGKAPTADPLGRARSGLGMALMGVGAVVLLWVGAALGTRLLPSSAAYSVSSDWFGASGEGSDTTVMFETMGAPLHVTWRAACPIGAKVFEWDGKEAGRSLVFAHGRKGSRTLPLPPGSYFLEVTAACAWSVAINPM